MTTSDRAFAWWNRRIYSFDMETTGVDVETARIVTAAVVIAGGEEPLVALTWVCDSGEEVPVEAAAIHGYTTERMREEGEPPESVIPEIIDALCERPDGAPVVIFNAPFDLSILDREARRLRIPTLVERDPDMAIIDPLVIDKHIDRYRRGSRKLDAICATRGARLDRAHDVYADALGSARAAWVLGAKGRIVRRERNDQEASEAEALRREWEQVRDDLPALFAAQKVWALDQRKGLREHFRRIGNPDANRVELDWPMVPFRETQLSLALS